jgi:hypothetical protein
LREEYISSQDESYIMHDSSIENLWNAYGENRQKNMLVTICCVLLLRNDNRIRHTLTKFNMK